MRWEAVALFPNEHEERRLLDRFEQVPDKTTSLWSSEELPASVEGVVISADTSHVIVKTSQDTFFRLKRDLLSEASQKVVSKNLISLLFDPIGSPGNWNTSEGEELSGRLLFFTEEAAYVLSEGEIQEVKAQAGFYRLEGPLYRWIQRLDDIEVQISLYQEQMPQEVSFYVKRSLPSDGFPFREFRSRGSEVYEILIDDSYAILITTRTNFFSDGIATLPVELHGHQDVAMRNGFSERVPVLVESMSRLGSEVESLRREQEEIRRELRVMEKNKDNFVAYLASFE